MKDSPPQSRFHIMAKPFGPVCNLDCTYCYYRSKEELLSTEKKWRMSEEILENFIRRYIQEQNTEEIVFSWQGGEPTLLGLDFFRKVVAFEKKYATPGKRIENDLQTNGMFLDEEWCHFLRENNFLVGLSIDGPQGLHETYRVDKRGKPSFSKAFSASKLLRKHGVPFNSLTVVNRTNATKPLEVYRFLRDEACPSKMQFIPCVEPKIFTKVPAPYGKILPHLTKESPQARPGKADSVVTDWSVDPDDYGQFLCDVFDEWYNKDIGKTFVCLFEGCLAQWMGMQAASCTHASVCGKCLAIEHDGNVYSCDHYVYPEYRLGNIQSHSLEEMAFSKRQMAFGFNKRELLPEFCRACKYLFVCNGECPKNRFLRTPIGESGLNYLCSGFKKFYGHIDSRMKTLAEAYSQPV